MTARKQEEQVFHCTVPLTDKRCVSSFFPFVLFLGRTTKKKQPLIEIIQKGVVHGPAGIRFHFAEVSGASKACARQRLVIGGLVN